VIGLKKGYESGSQWFRFLTAAEAVPLCMYVVLAGLSAYIQRNVVVLLW